jgi:pyruvate,orthophosphate dikinase
MEDLCEQNPTIAADLNRISAVLESDMRDMIDVEIVIEESGNILVIQARSGRRSVVASVKIAVDMVQEKLITEREALMKIDLYKCNYFVLPQIANIKGGLQEDENVTIVQGTAASQGAAVGCLAFSARECLQLSLNRDVIFCFDGDTESKLDDYMACKAAVGVVTIGGTILSDIVKVCRSLGTPCVVAANIKLEHSEATSQCDISAASRTSSLILSSGEVVHSGDSATVDGTNGRYIRCKTVMTNYI